MTFTLGFNVDSIVSTRTTIMTLVFITCYHTTMSLLIFENLFCFPAKKNIPCVLFCLKLFYLHDFQACKCHLNYCSPITVFSCHMIFSTGCAVCVRCEMFWDVGGWRCGMFRMWDVQGMGCSGWAMSGM